MAKSALEQGIGIEEISYTLMFYSDSWWLQKGSVTVWILDGEMQRSTNMDS